MDNKTKKITPAFQKGQQIGRYQIVGAIDIGKFADLYMGQPNQQNTSLQVTVLRPPLMSELQESFTTQAQAIMLLKHPHIVQLLDAGIEHNYPFLVTDYLSHRTLREVFPQGSKQPLAKFLAYIKQVASALQYAHERKILHGDIRPGNMLLNNSNQILLQGFTIEAILQNRERLKYQKSEDMGKSIAYSAPEQIQGDAQPGSDQYSLAIIIYELLSGGLPFTGSYLEVADKQMNMAPAPLQHRVPDISGRLEAIVMRGLSKNPEQRFPTIKAFLYALEQEQMAKPGAVEVERMSTPPLAPQPARPAPTPTSASFPATMQALPAIRPTGPAFPDHTTPSIPAPRPAYIAPQNPAPSIQSPPPIMPQQSFEMSPPVPRPGEKGTMSRRAFAAGLVGLAAVGGAGGWYIIAKKLAPSATPAITPDEVTPATPTTVNNTGALIFTGHLASVNGLTWSPDGSMIASASDDKSVQVFDARSGKRKLLYSGHTEEVVAVAWSPNGRSIVSGSQDRTAQIWSASDGRKILVYKEHSDRVNAVSWSSDSVKVASCSEDKAVQIWSAARGELSLNFQGHTAGVLCVGWQPGNSSVASGSWDATLRDWATVQHGDHFNAGNQIFNYGGHGKNEIYALTWSPDGNFIASAGADQTVQISNGANGLPRPPFFTGHQSKTHRNPVRSVAWSPDGNLIASGDTDGNVIVWKVAGRKTVFTYRGHKGAVNAVAWSPDGKRIASASADNTVHVWQWQPA